jgi:peptide/nickel transport system ATP-binding protein
MEETKQAVLDVQTGDQVSLEVKDLRVHYATPTGDVIAVNGVFFEVFDGETLGLVGESGCGKTTCAMGILRMVQPPGRIVHGQVLLHGRDLVKLSESELRRVRWTELALIPQGAMNSLNPTMRVKDQIGDAITTHEGRQSRGDLKDRILHLLNLVGLPARTYSMYPHELSGGMKQRVCIAMGICLEPEVIIADEFTSALDVVVQRVVAQTMLEVKDRLGMSMILIGHDMGLVAQLVDRVAVMYAGNMMEIAPVKTTFSEPLHPYTQLLISAIPSIRERKPLQIFEGVTHDLRRPPPGCVFHLRCPHVMDVCREVIPEPKSINPRHQVACHLHT